MQDTPLKIEQQPKIKTEKIKLPVLAPLLTSILVLLSTFTVAIYKLERKNITDDLYNRLDNAQKFFSYEPNKDGRLFGAMIYLLENDRKLQQLWLARDRKKLETHIVPVFKKLRDNCGITNLCFIDVNRVCFLRAHKPASFGDFIDRITLKHTSRIQKTSSGIELNKFGTFTFRLVQPWYINNNLTGYIEFGEEIGDISLHLKEILGADLVLLVDKKFLTCENWLQGRKLMGRSGDWDYLPNNVIADSTMNTIPPELLKLAALPPVKYRNRVESTKIDGFTYLGGVVDLRDAAGQKVGSMLVVKDVSQSEAALAKLLMIVSTLSFIVATMLASFFYVHITRIEKHLIEARGTLETEIEKRKRAEIELREHQDCLEETIKERTAALVQTNKNLEVEAAEREKARAALKTSEERLKQVAEKAGEWIWEINTEGLYTYASAVSERLLGYKSEEIVGKKYFYDFFEPQTKQAITKTFFGIFEKKESFKNYINIVIHKNGSKVILETTGTPILDEKGNLLGYRGIDRDFTRRKRAEDRLLAVSKLQERLLPPVPIEQKLDFVANSLVHILDADFARIWIIKPPDRCKTGCAHAEVKEGPHVCRFRDKCLHLVASAGRYTHIDGKGHGRVPFGCYKIGLIASGAQDKFLTNEATTEPRVHNHAWARELGLVSFAGYRLTHTDGTPLGVMALFSKHPILPEEDTMLEGIANSVSMAVRTSQMEENLRKNEEFTRRVIESSSDCIKVLDLEGRLLSMSGGGQKLLEIDDMAPYLNSSFIDFWKDREKEDCIEAISKAKRGQTGIFYGFFSTVKGKPKWWEVIVTPIKDADGNINRLLAVSRDITARKNDEKSIENLNRDLESTVTQLSRSNKQLSEFAHLAAHDLKTPLRGISTLSQWLATDYRDKLDEEGRRKIDLLIRRAKRLDILLDAILQYSTLSRNRQIERPTKLNVIVDEIITEMKCLPNIKIKVKNKLPVLVCNENHIRQVLYNLIGNAVKFMDKPQGLVVIDCAEKERFWEISVSDNGPGIERQHYEKIWTLFQTLDIRDKTENTGVGLTLVRKIVELYEGKSWLESEVGKGSTFYFTMPKQTHAATTKNLQIAQSSA
jgi:PAS domain S-box-containing protein